MRFNRIFSLISRSNATAIQSNANATQFINYPSCTTCKHYIPDSLPDIFSEHDIISFSKCKLFGYKDKATGLIINNYAKICRSRDDMCGEEGYYYKK
jgi:hypothetical protein